MIPLKASKLYIVEGIEENPIARQRSERLKSGIITDNIEYVDDEKLNNAVLSDEFRVKNHGMNADIKPVVVFNRYRFEDTPEERKRRQEKYPGIFKITRLSGYGGIDWRESGSRAYRKRTGLVCNPAFQLHSIVGCHFRCSYCHLGHFVNIMMNMEDMITYIDDTIKRAPGQTLYQYDNYTDTVCFEPEYGGSKLLVEYFAQREKEYLELYVGKSSHVDHLLKLDHKGHTLCCWSVSGITQSQNFEYKAASMEDRIESARLCQEAGYHVRFRLSPIIPVKNWQEENRELIRLIFSQTRPDLITFETLRFLDYNKIHQTMDTSLLDPEFINLMKEAQGKPCLQGCQIPHEYRKKIYRFIIDEIEKLSPETPYALCRASRKMWEDLEEDFTRHGQSPDYYVCNCGPYSAPGHELLAQKSYS
ncbi:hypothetical protein GF312_19095 [Candidatus Poribacteria bacterium]|nr:hypothetical protein [Candidatus Poribacteria bacterium]